MTLYLRQKFSKPMSGYWNGELREFDWRIDHPWSGTEVSRISSWGANHYFDVHTGKTDKATLGNARRALRARATAAGEECEFEYIDN
jgi:hypothetical protein